MQLEIERGNKVDKTDLSFLKGDSYRESCENGWLNRDCKKYKTKADSSDPETLKGSDGARFV